MAKALVVFCCAGALAATATGPVRAANVPPRSGAQMCVLSPADFRTFGTVVFSNPVVHVEQDGENVYCVYRGKSGATGGVELDVFYPAGATRSDVAQTFKTVMSEDPGAQYQPESVPGADESMISLNVPSPGYFPFAANDVRRGNLVFTISLPSSPLAKTELLRLSEIVLARLSP
jgi:hypothetical protein